LFFALLLTLFSVTAEADNNDSSVLEQDRQYFSRAVEYSQNENWAEAEPIYRDLLTRHKYWPELGNNLALLLLQTDRLTEAQSVFEQALNSTPGYQITQNNRLRLYQYMASRAYGKALGTHKQSDLPEFTLIDTLYQVKHSPDETPHESEYAEDSSDM